MQQIIRALRPRDPQEHHRVSTTLELFFDLVTVIAIASVTAGLHHAISEGHGLEALPRFLFLFISIWWCWMNFTWFASAFDNDDLAYRLLVMVIMLGELIFAGGAGHIFETLDFRFGILGWIVMRLGMIGLWLRAAAGPEAHRATCLRYAGGIAVAQLGWVLFYLLVPPDSPTFFLWAGLVFLVELSVPVLAERQRPTPFHRHHIIERYGLLLIISLGEIMLSVSRGFGALFGDDPAVGVAVVAVSGLAIVFSVWWVYFCEAEPLPSSKLSQAVVWGYGHVFVFMSAALIGAAIAAEVDLASHHSGASGPEVAKWGGLALALFCLGLWFVRDRMLPLPAMQRLALPGMAGLFLIAALTGAPAWAFALLAVGMVVWRTRRTRTAAA